MDSSAVGAAAARPTAAAPSASRAPRCCSTHSALTRPRRGLAQAAAEAAAAEAAAAEAAAAAEGVAAHHEANCDAVGSTEKPRRRRRRAVDAGD